MAAVTIHSDSGAQENKIYHCFHFFPFYLPWSDGLDTMISYFLMLIFKPTFSFYFFTLIKRFFSSSSLPAIRMVSSAYLGLLIFLPANLIPSCASSSMAFHIMYSAYKLNIPYQKLTCFYSFHRSQPLQVLSWAIGALIRRSKGCLTNDLIICWKNFN